VRGATLKALGSAVRHGLQGMDRWGWAAAVLVLLGLAALAAATQLHMQANAAWVRAQAALIQASAAPFVPVAMTAPPIADFTTQLPQAASLDPLLRDVQRHATALGVSLVALDANARAPTPQTLGRIDVSLTLRGRYDGVKLVLAQVFDRFPNLVAQRLTLRRVAGGEDLEAVVVLALLSRPQAVSR
jgi:hypothetical protein